MAIAPFRPAAAGAYLSAVPLTPTLAAAEQRADGQTICALLRRRKCRR